jgi:hypothetical protein
VDYSSAKVLVDSLEGYKTYWEVDDLFMTMSTLCTSLSDKGGIFVVDFT